MPTTPSLGLGSLPPLNPIAAQSPNVVREYLQSRRQQQLAQALMQQGQTPIDYDPRGRISWTQGLAKALQTGLGVWAGNKAIDSTAQAMSDANQATASRFPIGQPQASAQPGTAIPPQLGAGPSPQALAAALDPASQALATGAQSGSLGPTNANAALMNQIQAQQPPDTRANNPTGMAPQLATGPNSPKPDNGMPIGAYTSPIDRQVGSPIPSQMPGTGGSLVMPGMTPQQSMTAYLADPAAYMTELTKRSDQRTEFSKTMISAGIDPSSPQGQQLLADNLRKQNWIAPPTIRAGEGILDPRSGAITTTPSAAPAGFQNVQLADGSWGTIPVRGGTDAITQSTFAGEAGKAPFNLIDTFNPATGAPAKNYAGNVLPLPLAPGGSNGQPPSAAGQPTFNIAGTPQQRAAIFSSIANDPTVDPVSRRAAAAQLQQIQGGIPPQSVADARTNGVQTGPALGQGQGAVNAQDELSKSWAQQQQAHAAAQTNIGLLQSVKGLADSAITGYEPDRRMLLAQLGAYAGLPGQINAATSTDLLNKFSAQLIGNLSQKGMNTDAAREIVQAGTPNSHMQPQAIKDAVDGLIAREKMTQARTGVLQPYALNRDPAGFQATANRFDAIADPRLWQMRSMTPQQLQAFTAKMPAGDAQQLMQKYQAASQMGAFQ